MNIHPNRPRLLFLHLKRASFVEDDLAILRDEYEVSVFSFDAYQEPNMWQRCSQAAANFLRQVRWLQREISRADLVFGWFADYHMLLPVLLGTKQHAPVVVMLGGMDCNHHPKLNYGVWESWWRAPLTRYVVSHATHLLVSDKSMLNWSSQFPSPPGVHSDGLKSHVGDTHAPVTEMPLAFDPAAWPLGPAERPHHVLSVAHIYDERTLKIKGIDILFDVARLSRDVSFQVVGVEEAVAEHIRDKYDPPENVELQPPHPRAVLWRKYQQASVYAQLSRIESFGMVVGEAMLCGCIPLVSDVGALPRLAGSHGVVVDRADAASISRALGRALATSDRHRDDVREHIKSNFHLDARKKQLLKVLEEIRTGER